MSSANLKQRFEFYVTDENSQLRLDTFLYQSLKNQFDEGKFSRSSIKSHGANFLINGKEAKLSTKLKLNDQVIFDLLPLAPLEGIAEDIPLNILYEDKDLMVIHKTAGMSVHISSTEQKGTIVNALLHHFKKLSDEFGETIRPGIVHRLDKETEGCLIIAKHQQSKRLLVEAFANRVIYKEYWALVEGHIVPPQSIILKPIGRHPTRRTLFAVREDGKFAQTSYEMIKQYKSHSELRITIQTGRTHQIRVHLSSLGHPIVGDKNYNPHGLIKKAGMALIAKRLRFIQPITKTEIDVDIPLPDRIEKLLADVS